MKTDAVILEQYKGYWATYRHTHEFTKMAQVISDMVRYFGQDTAQIDTIEEMVDLLQSWFPLMDLDQFRPCAKTIRNARKRIAATRGTQYARGLSRQLTDSELAELRGAGLESSGSGTQGNGLGDEGVREFTRDLRTDDDDSD